MNEKEKFDIQLKKAIGKHGDEHIDIIVEENKVYGVYHSTNNSFSVTDTFDLEVLGGLEALKNYESQFEDLCICEE
jgi:hypothetical protein